MRKITLLLALLTIAFSWQAKAQVTIGTGTLQTENAPIEAYYGYTYSQSIYLASEINATGDITGLQWYYSGTSDLANTQDLIIYVAEAAKTEFASDTDWEPIGSFTQVYAGGITVTAGVEGWTQIVFDTPFTYNGTGNLIVAVEDNGAGYDSSGDDFYGSTVATNRSITYYNDTTNPDPATPPTANSLRPSIPNIILDGIAQACSNPSDLAASAITSDSAELSWTQVGTIGSWNIEVVTAGTAPTGTATETATTNPYTTTGLVPSTSYEFYVQADCGAELSAWAGPFAFATECVTYTAPYTEGFENAGDIPLCWSMSGGQDVNFDDAGTGHVGNNGTITGSTATNNYYAWVDASGTNAPTVLLSPLVDVTALAAPALSFYEISDNETNTNAQLDVEVWDGAAWNLMATYNTNTSGWELKVIDLSTLTITGDVQARFTFSEVITPGDFYDDIAIDDVTFDEAPSCFAPSNLTAAAITASEAELSWLQDGATTMWNIEIVTSGTAATGTATYTDTTNPYTVTGLMPVTSYDYYVQANCGADGFSGWVGPFTFTTECDVYIPDYLEDFTTIPADCWEEADAGDATTGPQNLGGGTWADDGFLNNGTTGAYKINLYQGGVRSDWILSPSFDLTGGPFQVEFDFGVMQFANSTNVGTLGSDDTVQLLISTDNGVTWTSLLTYDSTSVFTLTGEHPVIDLTAYSGQTVRFGILGSDGTIDDSEDNDIFVDNFQVRNIPTCPEPSDLAAANVTSDSAELSWMQTGTPAMWNIEIVTAGTAPTGTATETTATNPYTTTGLMPATNYEYYVQADCSGDPSSWTGPFAFTTECVTFTAPYTEGFENAGDIPLCWSMSGGQDVNFNDAGTGHVGDNGTITGTTATNNYYAWVDASGTNDPTVLLSPFVDVSTLTTPALSFYEISDNEDNTNAQLDVEVWDGAAWNLMATYDTNTVGWELKIIDLSSLTITGAVQARFTFSEVITPSDFYDDIAIDDVTFDEAPTCFAPTNLTSTNLSLTSTEIAWVANGGELLWNIEYGPEGFAQGTGTLVSNVATNPYTLTGLTADTNYDFYVQANCDVNGVSTWSGPGNFFTGYCTSVPTSHDGQGITSVTIGVTDFNGLGGQDVNGDDITYQSLTSPIIDVFQGIETNVSMVFETGYTYNTNIWIDFNDDLIFDASEIVFVGETTNANPTIFDATFTMPADAAIGEHRMRIGSADFGQTTPDPCFSGSFGVTLDFTVNIQMLQCTLAEATYEVAPDCANNEFSITVDLTSLGDATSLTISNDFDTNTETVSATGIYSVGPFAFGSSAKVIITSDQNADCTISSTTYSLAACPPLNDEPCDATVAFVNADETCTTTTSGTILEATASSVPGGSCSGDTSDDVWFEFTAVGTQQLISLENISGGTFNLDHAVYEGTCDNLTELYCSTDTNSLTGELIIGNTYFIRVFSAGSGSETTTFDLCIGTLGVPTYCLDALPICADPTLQYPSIVGDDVAPSYIDYDCLGSQPDPTWNTVFFDQAGDYTFTLAQTGTDGIGNDIDFIIWGPFNDQQSGCVDLLPANVADCSFSAVSVETITLNGVQAGDAFVILITNYSQDEGFYTFTQASGPTDGTNCEIVCDVELDYDGTVVEQDPAVGEFLTDQTVDLCGTPSVELTASSPYASNFEWYFNGIANGETTETITATETGTYQVFAYGGICEAITYSAVLELNFYDQPTANPAMDLEACDQDEDGLEDFDLESQTATILGAQSPDDFTVTYYASQSDADMANAPLTSLYSAADGTTIYVRVEDTDAVGTTPGCATTDTSFNLIVNTIPEANQAPNLEICDDGDNIVTYNLTDNEAIIIGSGTDVTVTYHTSMVDAEAGDNAIATPNAYDNTANPETIYVRVENNTTACYAITTFDLDIIAKPVLVQADDVSACDTDTDGVTVFDVTSNEAVIVDGQTLTVTYHTSQTDADDGVASITGDLTMYSSSATTIYVRAENATTGCYQTTTFDLVVAPKPLIAQPENIQGCDNDEDNDAVYNLTENETAIANGITGLTFTYHLTQADADSSTAAISDPTDYETSPLTIYVRAETAEGCFETTSFGLEIGTAPVTSFDTDVVYEVCPNATSPIEVTAIGENYLEEEVSIQWYFEGDVIPGENELVLDTVLLTGWYTIEVTFTETGCFDTAEVFVDELANCIIPQGISPNNDSINDTFDLSSFDVQSLEIFNRNGTKVYSKTNYSNEWYGQSDSGDELPVGTYFYVMKYQGDKVKTAWVYINREN